MNPTITTVLIAENVITEENTGKNSVIGIFDAIEMPKDKDKITISQFVVFLKIVGVRGLTNAEVKIFSPNDTEVATVGVGGKAPETGVVHIKAFFKNITFEQKGKYRIRVFLGEDLRELDVSDQSLITVV